MDIMKRRKDGGNESTVGGLFVIAIKKLFSIVVLVFHGKSREAYHNHAFNCISWVIRGKLTENMIDGSVNVYEASWKPVITKRTTFHKVDSDGDTLVISFRGPWKDAWNEFIPANHRTITLTHGRKVVKTEEF